MNSDDSAYRTVVGVDGSPSSCEALRRALRHTERLAATVEAVFAWEPPAMFGWSAPMVDLTLDEQPAQQKLADELSRVVGAGRPVQLKTQLVRGNSAAVPLAERGRGPARGGQPRPWGFRPDPARLGQHPGRPAREVPGGDRPVEVKTIVDHPRARYEGRR